MNELFRRVTGPDAISLPSALVLAFVMFFSNHATSGVENSYGQVTLAWAISMGAAFGWLAFAKAVLLKRPSSFVTISAFVVAFVLRAVAFDVALLQLGVIQQSELVYRLIASVPTFGFGLIVCAYIVSLARDFSRNRVHMAALRAQAAFLRENATQRVVEHRAELVDEVRVELDRSLVSLLSDAPAMALSRMRETIEQVVRPISRQLGETLPAIEVPPRPDGRNIDWSSVLRNSMRENPLHPLWFSLWVASAAWAHSAAREQFSVVFTFSSVVFVSSCIGLLTLNWCWRWISKLGTVGRASWLAFGILCVASFINLCVQFVPPIAEVQARLFWAYLFISIGIASIVAVTQSLRREVASLERAIQIASRELHDETVVLNTQLREQRLAIGRMLHGPVQDRITVAAFKLADAIAAGDADQAFVSQLCESLLKEIRGVTEPDVAKVTVQDELAGLAELWRDVVEISSNIDPQTQAVLNAHDATRRTIAEIVREACANAIRHGGANEVRVTVRLDGANVAVSIWNDGIPVAADSSGGVGSLLLNELALSWSLSSGVDGTTLRATVPLISDAGVT